MQAINKFQISIHLQKCERLDFFTLSAFVQRSVPDPEESLIPPLIQLEIEGEDVMGPLGQVYSTSPKIAYTSDLTTYVVKGEEDPRIVIAELLGHLLARQLGILVPDYAVGKFTSKRSPVFASKLIEPQRSFRSIDFWIKANKIRNIHDLSKMVMLDVWIANRDRNIGNVIVLEDDAQDAVNCVIIDFEKAMVVASKTPITEIPTVSPRLFFPTNALASILRGKLQFKPDYFAEIEGLTDALVQQVVAAATAHFPNSGIDTDSVCHILTERKTHLPRHMQDALP